MSAGVATPAYGYAFVVDDHPLVARGIAHYLTTHCRFVQARTFASGEECWRALESGELPELAVIDFWLPEGAAQPLLKRLSCHWPQLRLLAVSGDEDDGVQRTVAEAGAHGYLRKDVAPEVFAEAIAALRAGRSWFPAQSANMARPPPVRELP